MKCKIWEVWQAKIQFGDKACPAGKPVVVFRISNDSVFVFPTAKSIPEHLLGHQLEYWLKASLPLNSCVLMAQYKLTENDLLYKKGDIHILDINSIESLLGLKATTLRSLIK